MIVAGDQDRQAPALPPPADLPVHAEVRGHLGLKALLEILAVERLLEEELGAQEEAPAAGVGGVLVGVDDVGRVGEQEARDRYKALIIDSEQGPPTDPVKTSMPVEVARKILGYARAGLPVIVVGTPPDRAPGNTPEADPTLRSVIGELLRERSVSQVAHESDVPGKLLSLGIRPSAEPSAPSPVLSIRRGMRPPEPITTSSITRVL